MSYLENKYVNLLSTSLRNFKRKGGNLYQFSCPFCGDSATNKRKARGYVYEISGKLLFTCHNCSLTTNIPKLLKHVSPPLHEEYAKELMMERYQPTKAKVEEWKKQVKKPAASLQTIWMPEVSVDGLSEDHPCKVYVRKRMLPEEWYKRLWYSPAFFKWTNTLVPDKFLGKALLRDEGRLVIPLVSKDKKIFGYQGRSIKENLDKHEQKYYTIILDESEPKLFGLDRVDLSRKHYVLEGPLDAMFIPNAIATTGNALFNASQDSVFVYDNEPRSRQTCNKIQKAITLGYRVCIWPTNIDAKDVNELVMRHIAPSFIKQVIDERTYDGMAAQLVFNEWRKI